MKKKENIGGRIPLEKDDLRKPYKVYLNDGLPNKFGTIFLSRFFNKPFQFDFHF